MSMLSGAAAVHSAVRAAVRVPGDPGSAGDQEDAAGPPRQPAEPRLRHPRRQVHGQVLGGHGHGHIAYQVGFRVLC